MPLPIAVLSGVIVRSLLSVMSRTSIRRFVTSILVWEGAAYMIDFLLFTLKVKAANMVIGLKDDDVEAAAFAAWAQLTPADIEKMSELEQQRLVERYAQIRVQTKPGSKSAAVLDAYEREVTA